MKKIGWMVGLILVCFSFSCSDMKKEEPQAKVISTKDSSPISTQEPVTNPYAAVDVSPMDMSYFPVDYPKLKMSHTTTTPPLARVVYSRPHLQGRKLFHSVLKYGEPWRLGANEATELQLYRSAAIQNKKIPAGRYILYCIPAENTWTIVINSNIDSWGLTQDAAKDIARFEVPVKTTSARLEFFTMVFEKTDTGADLLMAWDNIETRLPFIFE